MKQAESGTASSAVMGRYASSRLLLEITFLAGYATRID